MHHQKSGLAIAGALAALALLGSAGPLRADDQMEYIGHYDPPFAVHWLDVHLAGNRAYVPGLSGLSVFDVSGAGAPVFLGRYQPPSGVQFYHATGSSPLAFVTARDRGIHVINTTSTPPALVAVRDEGTRSFEGILRDGNLLYVAAHGDGLRIYDVTDPQSFVLRGSLAGLTNTWAVDKSGTWLAMADAEGGLRIVDVTDPAAPALVASAPTTGAAQDLAWQGDTIYVACGAGGVDLFDASVPAAPVLLANYATTSGPAFLLAADPAAPRVYVATWQMVEAIDVADPAHPVRAGFEDTPVRAMGVAADASRIYVADWATFRVYRFGPTTAPDLALTPSIVSFPAVPIGQTADTTITVGNTGGSPLVVSAITTGNPEFQVSPANLVVPPGASVPVTLSVTPVAGEGIGNLRLTANDPDESGLDHLIDYGTVGSAAPDFTLLDLGGVPHALSELRGEVVLLAFFASW